MFVKVILKTWKLTHVKTRAWYLECLCNACPLDEAALLAQTDALAVNDLLFERLEESQEELEITAALACGSQAVVVVAITQHLSKSTSRSNCKLLKRSQQTMSEERANMHL